VGWVNSLDGTVLAPLQVFNAVPEPPFSAPSELAFLMAFDGHDIKRGYGEGCSDHAEISLS
jgi:hypothetical protein